MNGKHQVVGEKKHKGNKKWKDARWTVSFLRLLKPEIFCIAKFKWKTKQLMRNVYSETEKST